jgi:cell division protein FtsQ
MTVKRKISIRKILQMVTTLVVTTCCIIAMISAARIEDNQRIKNIAISIKNDKKYHFIEQQEIMDLAINNRQVDVEHTPLSKIDVHGMEEVILADPWVANAQVYIDNARTLNINVTQRIPVARIFQQNSASYYLDTTLSIMPLSKNYIYYTTVVTNVPEIKNDSTSWAVRKQIVSLVRTIQADTFWNAQISEVSIDSIGMFELTPVIGNQRIILGDISRVNDKLNNLFLFYKNVLNRIGWDKYDVLDLRFKDQVVASPSLPYKGPVDKAVVNMNWINSIVETEALNDAKDSTKLADAISKKDETKKIVDSKVPEKPGAKPAKKEEKKADPKGTAKAQAKKDTKKNNKQKDNTKERKSPKYLLPENKNH